MDPGFCRECGLFWNNVRRRRIAAIARSDSTRNERGLPEQARTSPGEPNFLAFQSDWVALQFSIAWVTAPPTAVRPPSTTYWPPVMLLARSEHRNSTMLAISSGVV